MLSSSYQLDMLGPDVKILLLNFIFPKPSTCRFKNGIFCIFSYWVNLSLIHLLQFFVVFNLLLCQSLFLNCLLLVLFSGESAKVTVIPPTMAEFTNTMILSSNTYLRSSLDFLIKNCTYMC